MWGFVGSIGGTLVLYIFPPAFYLRLRYMHRKQRRDIGLCAQYSLFDVLCEAVAAIIMVTGRKLDLQWNLSSLETLVAVERLLTSEVAWFQGL